MKTRNYLMCGLSICLLMFMFACQAQDNTKIDLALIEQIYSDPLAIKARKIHQQQSDLILYGKVDLEPITPIIDKYPDPCHALSADIGQIRGAREYLQNLCDRITTINEIRDKYPVVNQLSSDQGKRIFFGEPRQLSETEVMQLIEIRKSPDH